MISDINCKEASRLISHGLDETLPPNRRARLRLHFVVCQTCRDVNEQMQFLRRAIRQLGRDKLPGSPPPDHGQD